MNQKITFPELIELLARKQKCSKREAEAFLRELMALMTDVVSSGESLRINSLGVFKPIWVDERVSVNVQTGEPYTIPGHYKLTFTSAKAVREAVNEPFSCFSVEILPDDAPCLVEPQLPDEDEADDVADDVADDDTTSIQPAKVDEVEENEASGEVASVLFSESEPAISSQESEEVEPIEPEPIAPARPEHQPESAELQEPEPQSATPTEAQSVEVIDLDDAEEDAEKVDEIVKKAYWRGLSIGIGVTIIIVALLSLGFYIYKSGYFVSSPDVPVVHHALVADTLPQVVATDSVPADSVTVAEVLQDTLSVAEEKSVVEEPVAKVVTDTIDRNVFLTTISLRHYGHKAFWVYIYEENRHIISNPDRVPVGTVVVIPPAQKYGIDATDSVAIDKALKIADEIKLRNAL